LVIWNRILVDVVKNSSVAEKKLETFGVKDLQEMYERLYEQKIDFETKYNRLKMYGNKYSEYLTWPQEKQEKFQKKDLKLLITIPDLVVISHLKKKYPMRSIIEELDQSEFKEKGCFK